MYPTCAVAVYASIFRRILTFCKFNDGGAWGAEFVSFLTWTSLHSDKFTVKISFNCLPLFVHSIVFVHKNLVKENISVCMEFCIHENGTYE